MKASRLITAGIGVIFACAIGAVVYLDQAFERHTDSEARTHLTTMLLLRETVLRSYLDSLHSEVSLWSTRPIVIDVLRRLNAVEDPAATAEVADLFATRPATPLIERVQSFVEHHEYHDVFFVGPEGDVLLTASRGAEYGTNLTRGPFADTGLGQLFRALLSSSDDAVVMVDFSPYPAAGGEPAAFLGTRVVADGRFVGVYAIQIPEQPINAIMQRYAGMGETGETYLVGEDRRMRSASRFAAEPTVLPEQLAAAALERTFRGQAGVTIGRDYRGEKVYCAHRLFEFEGIRWAMLAQQDVAEVKAPLVRARYWFAGAFALLCGILLILRYLLIRMLLPSSIAALLGLSVASLASRPHE